MAFHGIVVYEIIDSGKILNGMYTNEVDGGLGLGDASNEIAIKMPSDNPNIQRYLLSINNEDGVSTGQMEIEEYGVCYRLRQSLYNKKKLEPAFEGLGFRVGNNHLSFTYWETEKFAV